MLPTYWRLKPPRWDLPKRTPRGMKFRADNLVVRTATSSDSTSSFSTSMDSSLWVVAREFLRLRGFGRSIEVRLSIPLFTMRKS